MSKQKEMSVVKGNWRKPREWSSTAQWVRNSENTKFYGGKHPRVRELIRVMTEDLYIKVLPYDVAQAIATTPMLMHELRHSVENMLAKYGKMDLIYGEVPKKLEKDIVVDGKTLALVNAKVSMPMGEFLVWLKGRPGILDKDTRIALSEWSGIPTHKMDQVYAMIVDFFRNETIEDHALAEHYTRSGVISGVNYQKTAPNNVVNIINPTFIF